MLRTNAAGGHAGKPLAAHLISMVFGCGRRNSQELACYGKKTMLRISAAAGVGEAESQAGCRVGGLSVGGDEEGREGVVKRAEGSAEEAFSQLSLCKPKAHKGNLCLT